MEQDLTVQISSVEQVPGTSPDEQGSVQVTVSNNGNESLSGGSLGLYASTDGRLDLDNLTNNDDRIEGRDVNALKGTDELLGSLEGIELAANESQTFTLDFASEEFRNPSVVAPGAYNLIAVVDPNNAVAEIDETNNQSLDAVSVDGTDAILDWNAVFLNASQAQGVLDRENGVTLTGETVPGEAPPIQGRDAAILSISQYEAVSAITGGESVYLDGSITPPEGASAEAAAVGAAYQVLATLFPEQASTFELQRAESLAEIGDSDEAERIGFDFGVSVANQILAQRAYDGVDVAQLDPNNGGYYEVTENGKVTPALLPNFGNVTPFAISSTDDFRPDGPPEYGSEEFIQETEFVRLLGGRTDTATTQSLRTAEQTEIAEFWANDRIDTFRPPGQWIEIAQEVALDQGNSLEENAQLFAQLNVALADAGIVAWDTKFIYDQQRPINTIAQDDLTGVTSDPDWRPLLDTPPFPDYISGHATFSGAAASVLESFFGEDVSFEVTSQELPGVTRYFDGSGDLNSFQEAALENANSRVYAGVHLNSASLDGLAAGQDVGAYVADNFFV
ncbi:MAG: phosphatase PAP2 family protein [Hydrococcus sp. SU_1_0]|nr:phosphatase PAP2 family protein [Hydrococcus sp. SU_1_0]